MSRSPLLDLLIVGGGPAGVAAALRAKELGLSALIIETDDVLRRIRDYSKDKLILPGFGGGDKMAFPDGGDWIAKLAFEPIDKDDLCAHWKTLCQQAEAPWRLATELLGLEDDTDGNTPIFRARIYDHRRRQEGTYRARHVALALGRGVPRRFDIPGDTTGIALRLDDPTTYVGAPACVIGGGTSAAEAVIAISNAKAASSDPTPIVWSYRGDRLPRVSKALAEVFFEAYAGNGNIRYHPSSEPLMVAPGPDRRLHLALRVDRRVIDGRAVETTLLEFPTEVCIACIGEDLPKTFLESLGIVMVRGGARGRERMVVNRLLETCRPRVYLMGDILSQAYLEAEDFAATPSTFREIRHRGNIKSALHDGVRVAEVVAQRVAGVDADAVEVAERAAVATAPPTAEPAAPSVVQSITASIKIPASMLQESGATEMLPKAALRSAWLVRLLPGGVDDNDHTLDPGSTTTLGRRGCDLSFPDDTLLSERAASITLGADGAVLRDEGSENGVFVQLPSRNKIELRPGDLLRAGRQFLVVEHDTESGTFSIVHYRSDGSAAGRHPVPDGSLVLGRRADLSLDREDASLSRRQMALTSADGRLLAKDLLSANGTYLRVQGARPLNHGDRFLVGQQRFAFSTERDAVFEDGPSVSRPIPVIPAAADAATTDRPAIDGPCVTFLPSGKTCPAAPDQTLLEIAEANGLGIVAECRAGICGSDPLRIVSGHEHLDAAPSDGEAETLEDLCGLEPGPCRLACMARIRGPVEVEILGR